MMATHDRAAVDRMRRRVVEMVGGKVVRDEEQGGYETPAPVSEISGNLPDDSTHREEHPLDDEELVADWDGAPEPAAAERESAAEHVGPAGADRSGEADGPVRADAGTDPSGTDASDADPSAEDRPVARDVLEEDLIDEREARRVRESEDFTGDFDQDQEELR